jgi:uncharacterized protein
MKSEHVYEKALRTLIRKDNQLMQILHAVRDYNPPDWLVGAGVLRNLVWDHLHDFTMLTPSRDIDVAFFDTSDLSPDYDRAVTKALSAKHPGVAWEATNQAAVHQWYADYFGVDVPRFTSCAEAIATWPETATCTAVHLNADNSIDIVAPFGLVDLFQMIVRRNSTRVSVEQYHRRISEKQLDTKWPKIQIIYELDRLVS